MKKTLFILFAVIGIAACRDKELEEAVLLDKGTIYASMELIDATRTSMDQNNNVIWSEGDEIVAFLNTTLGARYQIKEQYVGTTFGGFSEVDAGGNNAGLDPGQSLDHNVVLYPYSDQVWCVKNDSGTPAKAYKLNVILPETQDYAENSFADGAFPMVAVSSDIRFSFKNICGGVKLQFKGVDKIKSIKLEGLAEEALSGKSSVIAYADGSAPTITMAATASTSVTLDCGEGVQLNESTPTAFIIAVPPVTFASGMKITVTDGDGQSQILTNTSSNTVKRSTILNFPVITYKQDSVLELPEGALTSYEVPAEGGAVKIPIITNQDYQVVIPESAGDWISVLETRALRNEVVILNITTNITAEERSAEVLITTVEGLALQSISIEQAAGNGSFEAAFDLSSNGTANCYMISETGSYKFPAVKGNSLEPIGIPIAAEVLWESFGTSGYPQVGDLISSVFYNDGYVVFSTPETFKNGNAVIAVKDKDGVILWSWHIWCASEGYEEQVYANNAGTMMDRNLGATSATPGDVGALGLFYQWGRKDPFLGSSSITSNTNAKHVSSSGRQWNSVMGGATIEYVTKNPMTFITNPYQTGNLDWLSSSDGSSNSTLWQSVKTEYDPCPPGWKVPDGYGGGVWTTAGFNDMPYDNKNKGISFPASVCGTEAWYPAAGYLNVASGAINSVRFVGGYWSTATNSSGGLNYYLSFNNDGEVNPSSSTGYQVLGYSVRCQKENTGGGIDVPDLMPTDLSVNGTANCYLVTEPGAYSFPTVKGSSSSSVGTPFKAEVLWESFGTDEAPEVGDLISSVYYSDGKVVFTTPDVLRDGNALIALYDASNDIIWSWHIWCSDEGYEEQTYANGAGVMMDRNLGAVSAKPGDIGSLGLTYQWGRKDPFLSSSSFYETIQPQSTYIWPDPVEATSETGTPTFATKHPTTYIDSNVAEELKPGHFYVTSDWIYSSPSNYLWTSDKTIWDPCPAGWQVCKGGADGIWKKAGFPEYILKSEPSEMYNETYHGFIFPSSICGTDSWYPVIGGLSYYYSATPHSSTEELDQYAVYVLSLGEKRIAPCDYAMRKYLRFVRCCKSY